MDAKRLAFVQPILDFVQGQKDTLTLLTNEDEETNVINIGEEVQEVQDYEDLDMILSKPPWAEERTSIVLKQMMDISDEKNIPLVFMIPHRITRSEEFYDIFEGKRLRMWRMPHQGRTLDLQTLAWYGYNWKGADKGTLQRRPQMYAFVEKQFVGPDILPVDKLKELFEQAGYDGETEVASTVYNRLQGKRLFGDNKSGQMKFWSTLLTFVDYQRHFKYSGGKRQRVVTMNLRHP
jgi:hypothetical protein